MAVAVSVKSVAVFPACFLYFFYNCVAVAHSVALIFFFAIFIFHSIPPRLRNINFLTCFVFYPVDSFPMAVFLFFLIHIFFFILFFWSFPSINFLLSCTLFLFIYTFFFYIVRSLSRFFSFQYFSFFPPSSAFVAMMNFSLIF